MNKGTLEGTESEIDFVKYMNKNKDSNLWDIIKEKFDISDLSNYYCIRVTKHVISKLNNKKVFPKSDAYIIKAKLEEDWLQNNDFFIDESIYDVKNEEVVLHSGISIKRPDSKKFQILKMGPDSFKLLFGNYYLGAAASLYCNYKEINKNESVLKGWKTTWEEIIEGLDIKDNPCADIDIEEQTAICAEIKKCANNKIKNTILENEKLLDTVFKGKYLYDEPYVAEYIFKDGRLEENKPFDFTVTTGSGRSKGDFTIVLKPKEN